MIVRVIAAFGILLISIYLGIWLQRDPGYVFILFQHWTIETSFWVAMIAMIIVLILLHLGLTILKNIVHIPCYWQQWRHTRRLNRAQAKTNSVEIHTTKKKAYLVLLQENLSNPSPDFDLNQAMQTLPKDLKHDPDIMLGYADYLLKNHQDLQAEKYIRNSLKLSQTDELIVLYSQINSNYARIPFIESLIKQDPNSAALHLCLGRLLIGQQLWGLAKTNLEKSIQLAPSMQAYYTLGTLLERLDQQTEACSAYRQGLEHARG